MEKSNSFRGSWPAVGAVPHRDPIPPHLLCSAAWWRVLLRLTALILLVFLGPAFTAPAIATILNACHFPVAFHRLFDRLILIFALGALFFLRKEFHLGRWWPSSRFVLLWLGAGLLLALISAQLIFAFALMAPTLHLGFAVHDLTLSRVGLAFLAGLTLPCLEETLFRGFFLDQLQMLVPRSGAVVLSALLFAAVHFMKVSANLDESSRQTGPLDLGRGFQALSSALTPLVHPSPFSSRGLNYLIIGLILAVLALRYGQLWLGAGLHAGWILALFFLPCLLTPPGFDLLSSGLTTLSLLLLAGLLWLKHTLSSPEQQDGPETGPIVP